MVAEKVHIKEIVGGRFDNSFVLYHHKTSNYKYPVSPLFRFLIEKPQYGAGEAGVPRNDDYSPRYIRITDIDENGLLIDGLGVTAKNVEEKYILQDNDILIARSGNTVGKSYIHKEKSINYTCFFASYMIRFVVDRNAILPDYVFLFTKLSVYSDWVKVTQRVTGQPNINADEYSRLPIPVPLLDIQQEIVKIYMGAQSTRFKKIQESKHLLYSIDNYLLEILQIAKQTDTDKSKPSVIQNISSIIGGRFDPIQFHSERTEMIERIKKGKWCRLKDVVDNVKTIVSSISKDDTYIGLENIDGETGEYVPMKEKESISSAVHFKKGDILFPKLRPYLNKVYRAEFDGCCSTEFHIFQAHNIHPDFLTIVLRSNMVLAQTKHLMTGNTLPRLQTTDIGNIIIPYPDMELQEKIVVEVFNTKNTAKLFQKEGNALIEVAKQKIEKIIIG